MTVHSVILILVIKYYVLLEFKNGNIRRNSDVYEPTYPFQKLLHFIVTLKFKKPSWTLTFWNKYLLIPWMYSPCLFRFYYSFFLILLFCYNQPLRILSNAECEEQNLLITYWMADHLRTIIFQCFHNVLLTIFLWT